MIAGSDGGKGLNKRKWQEEVGEMARGLAAKVSRIHLQLTGCALCKAKLRFFNCWIFVDVFNEYAN